jgi:hypothetical protein
MEKVRARISEMPNRCKLVVESSRRACYSNVEEEIEYFGVSLKYTPVPSILTPTGGATGELAYKPPLAISPPPGERAFVSHGPHRGGLYASLYGRRQLGMTEPIWRNRWE